MSRRQSALLFALLVGCGSPGNNNASGDTSGEGPSSEPEWTSPPVTTAPSATMTAPASSSSETDADTSTGSSTAESDPSTGSGDGTVAFLIRPDGGGGGCLLTGDDKLAHCTPCSPWRQDCASGERCNMTSHGPDDTWHTTRCVDIDPEAAQLGQVCSVEDSASSGFDNCDIGLVCMHVDENLEGVCLGYCEGAQNEPTCADPQVECVISNSGAFSVCLDSCDPLAPDCGEGLGCYGIGVPGEDAPTSCLRPGEGVAENGLHPAECAIGSTDIPDDLRDECTEATETCCAQWCSTAEADACGDGFECLPWSVGNGELGVCVTE